MPGMTLSCGLGSSDGMQCRLHSIKAVVSKVCALPKFTGCESSREIPYWSLTALLLA